MHAALSGEPRPGFLDQRSHHWAVADRVAWEELPIERSRHGPLVAELAAARRPIEARSQLVHGDLTQNVLFADGQPPAIIDFTPYWRPVGYATAVVVADALVWEGAGESLVDQTGNRDNLGQYLLRALIFRLLSERDPSAAADRYRAAADTALRFAG